MKTQHAIAVTATVIIGLPLLAGCNNSGPGEHPKGPTGQTGAVTVKPQVTEEDLYHFNCLTMGNRKCGPKWQILDTGWKGQVRFENPKQDPTNCKVLVGDTTYIDCPNGRIYTS